MPMNSPVLESLSAMPPAERIAVADPLPRCAVIELFGQRRIAGTVREVLHGGTPFLRVNVPPVSFDGPEGAPVVIPGHVHDLRPANIYSIDWVDAAVATEVAHQVRHMPWWMGQPDARS